MGFLRFVLYLIGYISKMNMYNMDLERKKQGREGRREKRRESLVAEMVHSPSTQAAELVLVHLIISISKRQLHTYCSHSAYLCSLFYSLFELIDNSYRH